MANRDVPVFCYWNGLIIDREDGPCYDNPPMKAIKVSRRTTFNQLLDILYTISGFDTQEVKLKLVCRYPTIVQSSIIKYIRLPIADDSDVEIMLEIPSIHASVSNVELYLETEAIVIDSIVQEVPGMGSTPFMQLLTQEDSPLLHSPIQHASYINHQTSSIAGGLHLCDHESGTSVGMITVQRMVQNEGNNIFDGMHMNNNVVEEENVEGEELEDDSESNEDETIARHMTCDSDLIENQQGQQILEDNGLEDEQNQPLHEPNSTYFKEISYENMAVVSNWNPLPQNCNWNPSDELHKGLTFQSKDELRRAIKLYSIKRHQQYKVIESKEKVWRLRCKRHRENGCKWRLRAYKRKTHGFFEITQFTGPHTCVYPNLSRDHRQLDAKFLAQEIEGLVKVQPSITIAALKEEVKSKFHYIVSYKKMWQAKQKAIAQVFGDWDTSFQVLPKFMEAIQRYNEGTIVKWRYSSLQDPNTAMLNSVFWSFSASIEGFKHCRPVLSIDGTHLYGRYTGKMLIAMGVDANDQLFPLAFAIVGEESFDSWSWFLSCIRQNVTDREGLCLISDRHAGIIAAVNQPGSRWKEPYAYHRFCLRHLCSNFNDKFRDKQLKKLAYRAGSVHQLRKYNAIMDEIGKVTSDARKWLEEISLDKWTLVHDGGRRYGVMTTNLSEVFNSVLKGARNLPITACVQLTFYRLVSFFNSRRKLSKEAINEGKTYAPHILAKLHAKLVVANSHELIPFNENRGVFEVITARHGERMQRGYNKQVVELNYGICSCGKWQIYKFPCSHVLAVCGKLALDNWQYIDKYYSMQEHFLTWEPQFNPITHEDYWPNSNIPILYPDPNRRRKKKGRPKSTRIRNEMDIKEGRAIKHCGLCKQVGHDRRTCPSR